MIGELVMDRFRLERRIGSGGMGTVYQAFDERLRRDVALKEIQVVAPERTVREAQAAARLNHPGIVALYEFGLDGDRALLVSELVRGATLDALAREGALCDRDVAELGEDLCAALAHAHERGVVHRDIKPQNVIVRDERGTGRRAKLTDFGVAALAGAPTLTAPGEVVGTLAYMAPEQAEGERAGPPCDVYSLALTLYELWTGENPVRRGTPAQTARDLGSPLPPLASVRPDLPGRLCEVVDACLLPHPAERPTPAVLETALDAAASGLDREYAIPVPAASADPSSEWTPSPIPRLAALCALVLGCVALAGPLEVGGLALLVALLALPAVTLATSLERAALPLAALALGALSAAGAYPALAGALERTAVARFAVGALGWCWLLAAAAALGIAPPAELVQPPPSGWEGSASAASDALLAPLVEPTALLGALAFGTAAALMGWILTLRQAPLAALAAVVWAACLTGVLRLVGEGGLQWAPPVVAASALVAVAAVHWPRDRGSRRPAEPPPPAPESAAAA